MLFAISLTEEVVPPQEGSSYIWSIVGNILLHSAELYLAALVITVAHHYPLVLTWIHIQIELIQDGLSIWSAVGDCIVFLHQLMIESSQDLVPSIDSITSVMSKTSTFSCMAIGFTGGHLIWWILKWFLGF